MTIDTEPVRERKRNSRSCPGRPTHHISERALRSRFVPQIPLEIHNPCGRHERKINIVGRELTRDTKRCIHRALGIGSHADQASSSSRSRIDARGSEPMESDTGSSDIVSKNVTKVVLGNFANKSSRDSERR